MKMNKKQTLKNGLFLALAACCGTASMQAESNGKMIAGISTEQQAAQHKIKGNVVDENGEPVLGANVIIKGTTYGTVTDIDGNFSLNVRKVRLSLSRFSDM